MKERGKLSKNIGERKKLDRYDDLSDIICIARALEFNTK